MTGRIKLSHRLLSLLLCIALLAAYLPTVSFAAETALDPTKVADPSTMDDWKTFFPIDGRIHTENAGGVWTDKSVFTDASAFTQYGITQNDPGSLLVALSAMASNMTVTGQSVVPTDTMLVLDVSGSMQGDASQLVSAANTTIAQLLSLSVMNRVGVVLYSGNSSFGDSSLNHATVLLPLGRYTTSNSTFLTRSGSGENETVSLSSRVVIEGTNQQPASASKGVIGGTYIQAGIKLAMDQFNSVTSTTVTNAAQGIVKRTPIMVLMSDGAPTAATNDFSAPATSTMGDGGSSDVAMGFLTQLTMSYAKQQMEAKYDNNALFYTLGVGAATDDWVAKCVLNPSVTPGAGQQNNGSTTITAFNDYWKNYLSANVDSRISVRSTAAAHSDHTDWTRTQSVAKIDAVLEQHFVDAAYEAEDGSDLAAAFNKIVEQIALQSQYFPTLVQGSEHMSGYVSFVDRIGQYMEVTDIKGLVINGGTLFSGADMASNFVEGGGALGTYDAPTELGDNLVSAVMERLGLDSADQARTLIGLAYENGQLSYTSDTEFSNYIGWYANAAGEFLGFWHEGITTMPAPTGDAATDPVYINKSYGYLGAVNGHTTSDMMYAIVQLREEIATGEQSVIFGIPAALVPTVSYAVTLDEDGSLADLTVSGATNPIRLVYEVALDPAINAFTVRDLVDADYLAANTGEDGSVYFYSNQYEADLSTGYGKVNTYSYFRPSADNDRYYYQTDALVYTDTNGTLYRGDVQPSGTYYHAYTVYSKNGTALSKDTVYHQLTSQNLSNSVQTEGDTTWYIPAGNVRRDYAGYTAAKDPNATGTLPYYAVPYTDITGDSVTDLEHDFVVGATTGNNGRISLLPATGIALTKLMAPGASAPDSAFLFTITNLSDPTDSALYPAQMLYADGSRADATVQFSDGKATVALDAGATIYIAGMAANTKLSITEEETVTYVADTTTQEITVSAGELTPVTFINADRGSGNLTISKEVLHALGSNYVLPENLKFTVHVQLSGVGTAGVTFDALLADGSTGTITTDASGSFTLELSHEQHVTLLGLPAGTVATVTEPAPGDGFTASYRESGHAGDGIVTVVDGATVSVAVLNSYVPREVYPVNVLLKGTKVFTDNWNGSTFQFQLQKWTESGWVTIDTAEATEANPTFNFDSAMQKEHYTAPGAYYYQVIETNGGQTIDGITYDATLHTFGIIVSDATMDGQLEITDVISYHTGTSFAQNADGDWEISISFHNLYNATGCSVSLDVRKALVNASGSSLVSLAGFQFGLYDADGNLVAVSELTDGVGAARFLLAYELEDEGIHTYTLKEIVPDAPIPGMIYDDITYTVVVEVKDNGNGTTSAAIVSIDGQTEFEPPLFTNTYDVGKVELPIDFVSKTLTGREQIAGEFTFEIRDADGNLVLTGTNGADGKVTFDGVLSYTTVGTWFYTISEAGKNGSGITMDTRVFNLMVTVTDAGGSLKAQYSILNSLDGSVNFQNTYTAAPADWIIGGTKVLIGRTLLNDEFTFILTQTDDQGNALESGIRCEAKNFMDGSFTFPAVTFEEAGTYHFAVSELSGGSAFGIQYDATRYLVTVTVTDDGLGSLSVTDVSIAGADAIVFTNTYVPDPTSAQIPGSKTLEGKLLGGGDFQFALYASDESWALGQLLETVENAADGSFAFQSIDFETAGTWYYLVKEVHGGETIDGITYDDTVYHIRIDVTDDLRGKLHATVHVYDAEDIPQDGVVFVNRYQITGDDAVPLEGTKVLTGKELADGQFSFELYDESGKLLQTVSNKDGKFAFDLSYLPADAGKTFRYTVKEVNGGKTIDGITYDDAVFEVTVEVVDNGIGGIEATATVTGGPIQFTNAYEVAGEAAVTIEGSKILTGKDLADGQFSFELYDESGKLLQTVSNKDGKFAFDLSYLPADAGKTFRYTVKEVNGGKTIDGITYDDAVFEVTVEVVDNGIGGIEATATVTGGPIRFTNAYEVTGEAAVTIEGTKILTGRDLAEGEFIFELYNEAGELLQSVTNGADGSIRFAALSFTAPGTYRFTVAEKNNALDNVTYDTARYEITVTVTDNGIGGLNAVISQITKDGAAAEAIAFENIFVPDPDPLTVEILAKKTVKNLGLEVIGPEGFQFLLENMTLGTSLTALSDADGLAKFALNFTVDDIGKTYTYKLSEINDGRANVEYSTAVYNIAITISLDDSNHLVATILNNGAEVASAEGAFENIHHDGPPKTGDSFLSHLFLLVLSAGAVLTLTVQSKKKEND